jgi:hypothetical protein
MPARNMIACVLVLSLGMTSHAQVFYDGAAGGTPESQPWLTYQSSTFSNHHSAAAGSTTLDTTSAASIQAGWHNHNLILSGHKNGGFPVLDRAAGFTVTLDLRMIAETHVSNDRAGFSLIALSSDNRGIELGFWTSEIWAQSGPNHVNPAEALFTHAEGVAYNTASAVQRYELNILGNNYSLAADGTSILSGLVRDYSSWPGFPNVYALPNFLFLGDNTGSASGQAEISFVAIPEPAGMGLLACVSAVLLRRRRH